MKFISQILEEPGFKELILKGAEIFIVGGAVRDHFLGKEPKDLDLVIRGLEIEKIESILKPFGFIKEVGKSFGILKFQPFDWNDDIDIALPRTEKKNGFGHQGFIVHPDHKLPLIDDLSRRDITINSIAMSLSGEIIDPFNGLKDLKNKIIKTTSPKAFIEDPLRILRSVQFSSRFNFDIESSTLELILQNISSLHEISGERILIELEKIFTKGDHKKGFELLVQTKVHHFLTDRKIDNIPVLLPNLSKIDFFFNILQAAPHPEIVFQNRLKGDRDTTMGIKALKIFKDEFNVNLSKIEKRFLIIKLIKISNLVLESKIILNELPEIQEFIDRKMPFKISDLAINGDILKEIKGFKEGIQIGNHLNFLLKEVLEEKRNNTLEDLVK